MDSDTLATLKERMRSTWMAGDFGEIAKFSAAEAETFIARLPIQPGQQVLDVACGTGNLAVPAARRGAVVTGVDIAPNLLEKARVRAGEEGLQIEFIEGDAEQLPFVDGRFDLVVSMFGAMFAPRPELVASELARVCRPNGLIAMANWTPEGFVGKTFALTGRYVPPPPGLPAPVLWGTEQAVRERFANRSRCLELARREVNFDYPFDAKGVVEWFRRYFGPTQAAFARLAPAEQSALARDLEDLWKQNNQGSEHRTKVAAEYLEVRVTR